MSLCTLNNESFQEKSWMLRYCYTKQLTNTTWRCNFTLKCKCKVKTSFLSVLSFCKEVLVLHISALLEIVTSAILTLLLSDPTGNLAVRSCRTQKLSDWYTLLHNPSPNYEDIALHAGGCISIVCYILCYQLLNFIPFIQQQFWNVTRYLPGKKHCCSVDTKHS